MNAAAGDGRKIYQSPDENEDGRTGTFNDA
jgi:hypothetical protein